MPAARVTTAAELADALRDGIAGGAPGLIEVPVAGSTAPLW